METQIESEICTKTIYKYENSKKIYFAKIMSKYFLVEKNDSNKIVNLLSRNTIIYNLKTGMLLFSNDR